VLSKAITLKRSLGLSAPSPLSSAERACSMELPDMDPLVSMMNDASRGMRLRGSAAASGGSSSKSA
jgi:hypothetical protein